MKIVAQVFATFFFVSLILGSLFMVVINFMEASEIEELQNNPFGAFALALAGDIASAGTWRFVGVMWALLLLGSIVGIVATFLRSHKFGLIVGIALIVLSFIIIIAQPSIPARDSGDVDPRMVGVITALFGILAMGLMILRHTVLKESPVVSLES